MNVGQSFKFKSSYLELAMLPCYDWLVQAANPNVIGYIYIYMERLQLVKCHNI